MDSSKHNKIDFNLIKELFGLKSKKNFIQYLRNVYPDFYTKDDDCQILGVSKIKFTDFIKLPVFLCEKFFFSINKHKSQYLSLDELTWSLCQLYFGTLEETSEIIFNIYDFDHDGKVYAEDVFAILSFLPLKEDKTMIKYKYQLESLEELNDILAKTFMKKPFLTFSDFCEAIRFKSDIFLQLLCYLYQRCSFKEESLRIKMRAQGSLTQKTEVLKIKIPLEIDESFNTQVSKRNYSTTTKAENPFTEKLKNNLPMYNNNNSLISSPSEKTHFSPVRDFLIEGINKMHRSNSLKHVNEIDLKKNKSSSNPNAVPSSYVESAMEGVVNLSNYTRKKYKTEFLKKPKNNKNGSGLSPLKSKFRKGISQASNDDNYVIKLINQCCMDYITKSTSYIDIVDFPDEEEEEEEIKEEDLFKNILLEGPVSMWSESKKVLKQYWMVLVGHDLIYCTDETKKVRLKIKNLLGCFIRENGDILLKGQKYTMFSIIFRFKTRKFLVKEKADCKNWTNQLRVALEYKNFFDSYEMLDDIGSGSYGTVKLGVYRKTKQKVAIKIIQKAKLKPDELDLVLNEIDVLKFCKHPSVINFLDHFENSEYIFIILEYIKYGDLREYLNKKIKDKTLLAEERAADISYQIAEGLQYLHKFGIVHRDLKLENIMISRYEKNQRFEVKILDFGLSKIIGPKETLLDRFGTLYYISPEIVLSEPHNKATDIWSYGVLVYNLLSGEFPFDDEFKNKKAIAKKIVKENVSFPDDKWKHRSKHAKELIQECLNKDMFKRIRADQILKADWFKLFSKK